MGMCEKSIGRKRENKIEHLEASVYELQEAMKELMKSKPKPKAKAKAESKSKN